MISEKAPFSEAKKPRLYNFAFYVARKGIINHRKINVVGHEHIPSSGNVIVASTHRSVMDPIYAGVAAAPRAMHYMAKQELFELQLKTLEALHGEDIDWKLLLESLRADFSVDILKEIPFRLLKPLVTALGGYPVNRKNPSLSTFEQSEQILRDEKALLMFLEGTSKNRGPLIQRENVYSGAGRIAVRTKSPIVPFAMASENLGRRETLHVVALPKVHPQDSPETVRGRRQATADLMDETREAVQVAYEFANNLRENTSPSS